MGFVPFLKIILFNQLKNKASSVGSIMGVIIAIAFITGTFMTSEAIVSDLFISELDELDIHFTAHGYDSSIDGQESKEMMNDLRDLDGVGKAGLIIELYADYNLNSSYLNLISGDQQGIEIYFEQSISIPAGENMTLISKDLAKKNGLNVGDQYNLTRELNIVWTDDDYRDEEGSGSSESIYYNVTMNVGGIIDDTNIPADDTIYRPSGNMILMSIETMEDLEKESKTQQDSYFFTTPSVFITIDPEFYSNIDDVQGTRKETKELKGDINKILSVGGLKIDWDRVGEVYENYIYWSTTMRVFLVIMSLPLFLLCFYLVLVGSRIGMDGKVQEISLLKVKGAAKGHIFSMLMFESISHGIIGSLAGILLGGLLSSLFIGQFLSNSVSFFSLLPGVLMSIVLVLISCIFVILIRLRSTWRLSRMNILEAARGSPERSEKEYRSTLDVVIVTVTFLLIGIMSYFNETIPKGMGELVVYSIVETVKPILVLVLPFLLILSLSRVLILGIPGTLSLVAKPLIGLNKELHSLLIAGLKFGKRRVAIMAILISISLSFGILVLSQMETREASMEKTVNASIPTDIYAVSTGDCWAMDSNISSVPGVTDVLEARSFSFSGSTQDGDSGIGWFWSRAIGFNSSEYSNRIKFSDNLLIEGQGPSAMREASTVPGVIVNKPFMAEYDVSYGDMINISLEQQWSLGPSEAGVYWEYIEEYLEVRIIGVVDHLPGLRSNVDKDILESQLYGYDSLAASDLTEEPCLYLDLDLIPERIGSETWIYLIEADGDSLEIEKEVKNLSWKGNISATTTRVGELDRIKNIPANRGMDLVLIVQFGCVLISVIVGLFLLQLVSSGGRKREFAEIMSRGATRENIFKLLLSEGIVVMVLGLVIGTGVGLLVGYSFQTVFTGDWTSSIGDFGSGIDIQNQIMIEQGVIFPPTILLIHLVTIVSSLVAVFIVSMLSTRIDIASNLRLRRS
jgi:ABC-type antimicrobial peptide transport system permease subunit